MGTSRSPQTPLAAVARDIATYGVMSAVSRAGGLLLLPVLTRVLSREAYGSVDIVATFVALLTIPIQVSLPAAIARDYLSPDNAEGPDRLVSTLLAFVAGLGAVVAAAAGALSEPAARLAFGSAEAAPYLRLGCVVAWLTSLLALVHVTLRMQRRIVATNLLVLLQTAAMVGIALLLVVGAGRGVRGVFEAQIAAQAAALLCALVAIREHLTLRLSLARLRAALRFSLPLVPGRISVVVNDQADRVLLLAFVGLGGVGLLGVAVRIASLVQFATVVFRQAWQPHAMQLLDSPRRNDAYRRMLDYYAGGFATLGVWLSALAPELLAVAAPAEYADAYRALPWLVGAAVLYQSASITTLGPQARRQTGVLSRAATVGMLANVALGLALIPRFGIGGAAVGSYAASLLQTTLLWRRSVADAGIPFDPGNARVAITTYTLASAAHLAAWSTLDGTASTAARIAVATVASCVLVPRSLDAQAWNVLRQLGARLRR